MQAGCQITQIRKRPDVFKLCKVCGHVLKVQSPRPGGASLVRGRQARTEIKSLSKIKHFLRPTFFLVRGALEGSEL